MKRLALETSTRLGSLAIADGPTLVAETVLSVRATHSETVLDEVDRLFDRAGWGAADLDAVVVGAGPGSFTGVRISASLAKGLCFAHDLDLFAYSSLHAVAASVAVSPVCALFDARRDEVYAAVFEDPGAPPVRGPQVGELSTLLDDLGADFTGPFAGEGAVAHRETIESRGGRVLPAHMGVPRASALLWLSRAAPGIGRVEDRGTWEPGYVRAPGAERRASAGV